MYSKNVFLGCMAISYICIIIYTSLYIDDEVKSISKIITDKQHQPIILGFMSAMGFFTIQYELLRNDFYSSLSVFILLFGIVGVILCKETTMIHYVFAFLVFLAILFFMRLNQSKYVLNSSLYSIQVILAEILVANLRYDIFILEVGFLLNFAIYYLLLHFISS